MATPTQEPPFKETAFYGAKYKVSALADQTLNIRQPSNPFAVHFRIPPANDLIPETNEQFLTTVKERGHIYQQNFSLSYSPSEIHQNNRVALQILFNLQAESSAENMVLRSLGAAYLSEALRSLNDQAEDVLANAKVAITSHATYGLVINGFSTNMERLAKNAIATIFEVKLSAQQFATLRQTFADSLRNEDANYPYRQAAREMTRLQLFESYSRNQLVAIVEQLTASRVEQFLKQNLSESYVDAMAFGGMTKSQANAISQMVIERLRPDATPPAPRELERRPFGARRGVRLVHRDGPNSALDIFLRLGDVSDTRMAAATEFLQNFIPRHFFNDLRTQRGNVYVANAAFSNDRLSIYLDFVVQSQSHPQDVGREVQQWISETVIKHWAALSPSDFESLRASILENLKTPAADFKNEARMVLRDHRMNFEPDRRAEVIEAAESLTQEDIGMILRQQFVDAHSHRFAVYVLGDGLEPRPLDADEVLVPGD